MRITAIKSMFLIILLIGSAWMLSACNGNKSKDVSSASSAAADTRDDKSIVSDLLEKGKETGEMYYTLVI